ncbi:glycosyltransferase family 2 protein [Alishewanella sp. SMS8]|uniref:glycosyltransferase family 2 protein n=1 Tax=Alishewanella sp. SMS8 TaxID=2994676 RepID=UPI002741B146|nr:glycosyltransferase family A protein [Alishewanella sp. SMS8]MDP5460137.1 glycosyltransferase family A protein [Alishewanella sp. SMS8]
MNSFNSIDVLISTYGDRIDNLKTVIQAPKPGVNYLIGHQSPVPYDLFSGRDDVHYFQLDSLGVAKSRNFLLNVSTSDICYFCDDDIILADDFDQVLFDTHNNDSSEVITYCVRDEFGNPRKKILSPTKIRRNIFNILSVGTIEISLKRKSLGSIRFSENMGAGSLIPVGDESVFLSEFIKSQKAVCFFNRTIAYHPQISSGYESNYMMVYARGYTIRKVYGLFLGFLVLSIFSIKRPSLVFKPSVAKGVINYIKGFFAYSSL